ncbi:MAG: imidazole glycerol phosphate synthase subunit HisH [Myxococcales bacterium]|nr:imidazole glycerol phosphate synthase subunit HisH [Myxococcales bacterium]
MSAKKIAIVNYGMGNVDSVGNALAHLGGEYFVTNEPKRLDDAHAIVLPGVGAFGAAMDNLRRMELVPALERQVKDKGKPYLGICLGMQLLAKDSVEQGFFEGLGWLDAHVLELPPGPDVRLPHVGWNTATVKRPSPILERVTEDSHFFFDHSYHLACDESVVTSTCTYGATFVSSVQKDNVLAVQFHPEKSQRNGLKMLRAFLNFVASH